MLEMNCLHVVIVHIHLPVRLQKITKMRSSWLGGLFSFRLLSVQRIRRKQWILLTCALLMSIYLFKYYMKPARFETDELLARWRHSGGYADNIPWKPTAEIPPPLRVYVVEEHHEVIPFWVDIVKAYGGKKATLIHIDAHSDLDYPELVPNFPIGRAPNNDVELSTLMQANDQFIQSAVVAQLINTTYVIYPSWTSNESLAFEAKLGLTDIYGKLQLCLCFFDEQPECIVRDWKRPMNNTNINYEQCNLRWMYNYLELKSQSAPDIIKSSKRWSINEASSPLILDIDEDFFGVHLVARNLTEVDMSLVRVKQLDECIQDLFCPRSSHLEPIIDQWFTHVVRYIQANCFHNYNADTDKDVTQRCTKELHSFILRTLAAHHSDWLCDVNIKNATLMLTNLLLNPSITTMQLTVLEKIGLCLTMAWSTHFYEPHMRLCVGHNTPGSSLVQEYVPDFNELYMLASNVTMIMLALPNPPSIVTICRSSRDGYTPRWLQSRIETILLGLLTRVFHISRDSIYYSPQLAGGWKGWNERHG